VRSFRQVLLVIMCLGITGRGVGWADPAHVDWVEDPYAPHQTSGSEVRFGTAAGFLYGEGLDVLTIGLNVAAGHRFGRLTLEAEFTYLSLEAEGPDNRIGDGERLGGLARLDVIRLGPHIVGPNSMMSIYIEGGAAMAWNHWYGLSPDEMPQTVPANTRRIEGQAGFGILLDHRLEQPIGFPHRIGWFIGWRLAFSPEPAVASIGESCRGMACPLTAVMPSMMDRLVERSMLFQSSLAITW
jgi:hypothetical protein